MSGMLDGGRGEYGCWYNLETRGADILYAEFTVESYMGGSLCTGTWASEDCLIYALTEETQTEGESVAVTSQITIEGIRGMYTAKDIQRESVFEKNASPRICLRCVVRTSCFKACNAGRKLNVKFAKTRRTS